MGGGSSTPTVPEHHQAAYDASWIAVIQNNVDGSWKAGSYAMNLYYDEKTDGCAYKATSISDEFPSNEGTCEIGEDTISMYNPVNDVTATFSKNAGCWGPLNTLEGGIAWT